jgi:hypothetical protein
MARMRYLADSAASLVGANIHTSFASQRTGGGLPTLCIYANSTMPSHREGDWPVTLHSLQYMDPVQVMAN